MARDDTYNSSVRPLLPTTGSEINRKPHKLTKK